MAKKQTVTKRLRPAPSSGSGDTLAQWITQGQSANPPFADDLTIQRSDDSTTQRTHEPKLRVVPSAEPKQPRKRSPKPEQTLTPKPGVAGKSLVSRKDGPRRQVTYYIGPGRALELKIRAVERDTTMMAILGELIASWLSSPASVELPDSATLSQDRAAVSGPALVTRADGSHRYRVNAYLEPEQATQFKIAALRLGREMSEIVDGLVALELAR
jgi:hypothetical protein